MLALTIIERIVDTIEPAFLTAGYLIIAVAVLLERSVFVGLLVPGDVILALGGVYASRGRMNVVVVILVGIVAAISGESIGYWLGRKYGARLVKHVPFIGRLLHDKLESAQEHFQKRGGMTVALGRYATAAGAFIPFSAGVGRMPFTRFLKFDVPAIMLWATGITLFGYVFGSNLPFIDKVLSRFGYVMLGLLVGYLGGRFGWKRWKDRQQSRERANT